MENEVRVELKLSDGTIKSRRFDTCEQAWMYQRETTRKNKNRRAKADRLETLWAFYVGCTCYGDTYGGMLVGHERHVDLDYEKEIEFRRAKSQSNWVGPSEYRGEANHKSPF